MWKQKGCNNTQDQARKQAANKHRDKKIQKVLGLYMKQAVGFADSYITVKIKNYSRDEQRRKNNAPYLDQQTQLQPSLYGKVKKPLPLISPLRT
jgi:hypothetical protein